MCLAGLEWLVSVSVSMSLSCYCNKQTPPSPSSRLTMVDIYLSFYDGVQINRCLSLFGSTHPMVSGPCHILCRERERERETVEGAMLGFHVPGLKGQPVFLPHQPELNHVPHFTSVESGKCLSVSKAIHSLHSLENT